MFSRINEYDEILTLSLIQFLHFPSIIICQALRVSLIALLPHLYVHTNCMNCSTLLCLPLTVHPPWETSPLCLVNTKSQFTAQFKNSVFCGCFLKHHLHYQVKVITFSSMLLCNYLISLLPMYGQKPHEFHKMSLLPDWNMFSFWTNQ